jgi:hypothetical protein
MFVAQFVSVGCGSVYVSILDVMSLEQPVPSPK